MPPTVLERLRDDGLRVAATDAGKAAGVLSRRLGRGGGTSLPGLVAERISPSLVRTLAASLPNGCVLVTGTNGKTTTTRMLADAMRRAGLFVVSNREGSNLMRGICTELLNHCDALGRLRVPDNAIGIFEVDEAALVPAVEAMEPRLVLFNNLFRDQLDRYFEVDYLAHLWAETLKRLPKTTAVVLNADDPQVAYLGEELAGPVVYFGLEDTRHGMPRLEHYSDSRRCLSCSTDLQYQLAFYAHLGHYSCPECGWTRPKPRITGWRVELNGMEGSTVEANIPWGTRSFSVPLPSLYNVYNALAAAAAAFTLGADADSVTAAIAGVKGAFARLETFSVGGKQACLTLVKNPTGFNESLRLVLRGDEPKGLMFALNDNVPDGRDVSWIWDVDFEQCRDRAKFIVASGLRAEDLALRLKYAGLAGRRNGNGSTHEPRLIVEPDILTAFSRALEMTGAAETLQILPTYTAMWTLREHLARGGYVQPFWRM